MKLSSSILLVLLLAGFVDIALRFIPLELLSYRPWEAARVAAFADGPFAPNLSISMEKSVGDLAYLANRRDLATYQLETFETDRCGFRNPPELLESGKPVDILLLGDSFSLGNRASEDATPRARLAHYTGLRVYDLSTKVLDKDAIQAFLKQTNTGSATALLFVMERVHHYFSLSPSHTTQLCDETSEASNYLKGVRKIVSSFGTSRLEILAQRALRTLENDTILPHRPDPRVAQLTLRDGRSMLFWKEDIAIAANRSDEIEIGAHLEAFTENLQALNLKPIIVLVPNAYSVYHNHLANPPLPLQTPSYLQRLARILEEKNIPIVSLESVLQDAASLQLESGQMVYWTDDTHWNKLGIDIAMRWLAENLQRKNDDGT